MAVRKARLLETLYGCCCCFKCFISTSRHFSRVLSTRASVQLLLAERLSVGFIMRVPLCGDPAVGKTSLVRTLATGDALGQNDFDTSSPVDAWDGKLTLVDTNGQEDNDRMRSVSYKDADAFLILFSIISPNSYTSVLSKVRPAKGILHMKMLHICTESFAGSRVRS